MKTQIEVEAVDTKFGKVEVFFYEPDAPLGCEPDEGEWVAHLLDPRGRQYMHKVAASGSAKDAAIESLLAKIK